MRISDWSSDVCSSDLRRPAKRPPAMMRGTACALSLSRDRQPPSKTGGVPPELRLHEGGDDIIAVIVHFVQAQCQLDPRRVASIAQTVPLKLSGEALVSPALIHQNDRKRVV